MELFADSSSFEEILTRINNDNSDEPVTIRLAAGIYRGPYEITHDHITLIGAEDGETRFSGNLAAKEILDDGQRRGTFRSQTFFVDADFFTAETLSFANEAGPGEIAEQALALYSDGDNLHFDHCRFLGFQDTLFTAPLPPNELQSGGFKGPKEFAPRRSGRQLFTSCYIEGTVDFIFGGGACYFDSCEIYSHHRPDNKTGYVTAASTPQAQKYGYVFNRCRFTGDAEPGSVYLGRPWRDYAKVTVMNSYLDYTTHPDHWHDWNKPQAHATVEYYEYNNYGPGAAHSLPDFARFLTEEEARDYTLEAVMRQEVNHEPI